MAPGGPAQPIGPGGPATPGGPANGAGGGGGGGGGGQHLFEPEYKKAPIFEVTRGFHRHEFCQSFKKAAICHVAKLI